MRNKLHRFVKFEGNLNKCRLFVTETDYFITGAHWTDKYVQISKIHRFSGIELRRCRRKLYGD
jgi:hypothetical protein